MYTMMKYYFIPSENKVESFSIQCESKLSNGNVCYLANLYSTGEEVWLYKDAIEYTKCRNHKIIPAYEVDKPLSLTPYEYFWGGQIRDKRTNSMCARPYFRR